MTEQTSPVPPKAHAPSPLDIPARTAAQQPPRSTPRPAAPAQPAEQSQPAAQTLPADVAVMPPTPPLDGLVTAVAEERAQLRPFQCRIRPLIGPATLDVTAPTAHALRADRAVTEVSTSPVLRKG